MKSSFLSDNCLFSERPLKTAKFKLHPVEWQAVRKNSGTGGSRTRVQTVKPYGFYMLIRRLVFECRLARGRRPAPYLLYFTCGPELPAGYPSIAAPPDPDG